MKEVLISMLPEYELHDITPIVHRGNMAALLRHFADKPNAVVMIQCTPRTRSICDPGQAEGDWTVCFKDVALCLSGQWDDKARLKIAVRKLVEERGNLTCMVCLDEGGGMDSKRSCPQCSNFVCNSCFVEMCSTALAEDERRVFPACPNCRFNEAFKHEPMNTHLIERTRQRTIEKQALKRGLKVTWGDSMVMVEHVRG